MIELHVLSECIKYRKELEKKLISAKEVEAQVRDTIHALMLNNQVRSTEDDYITVTAVTRKEIVVADEIMVRTGLQSNGVLDECLRLDLAAAKRYAKQLDLPGFEEKEIAVLQVREKKEEPEVLDQGISPAEQLRNEGL